MQKLLPKLDEIWDKFQPLPRVIILALIRLANINIFYSTTSKLITIFIENSKINTQLWKTIYVVSWAYYWQ